VDAYGERVAGPVGAMMTRIRDQGRERESSSCVMPPRYATARAW
jgi:phytoene/squalene synthetase